MCSMATYKVIQDVEAEDKLIGPLTLRQFIYGLAAALFGYLTFLVVTKGAPFMAAVFLPMAIIPAFFAWPWGRDQPTEVWALAKIRFLVKPRQRIWSQSGVKELVTITVPKKIETVYTNGLSQTEVHSRLQALADTIDSRGWAIKNVNVNMSGGSSSLLVSSDRLISPSSLPQQVPSIDVRASDDMLDVQNNPVAQQFNNMIAASTKAHRQQVIAQMQAPVAPVAAPTPARTQAAAPQNNYWFLNEPSQPAASIPQDAVTFNTQVVTPGADIVDHPDAAATPTPDEEAFIKQLKKEPLFSPNKYGHLHVIQPLSAQKATAAVQPSVAQLPSAPTNATYPQQPQNMSAQQPAPPVTRKPDTAILDLVRNNDLNVATIAREVHKRKDPPQDEVVISLH